MAIFPLSLITSHTLTIVFTFFTKMQSILNRPYNPKTQGVFERNNSTISKVLLCKFIENRFLENLEYNFNENENYLLKNNFWIMKQKDKYGNYFLTKNKVKKDKSFYKLYTEINRVIGDGNYIIKILFNYRDYNIFKGNRYNVSLYYTFKDIKVL